MKIINYETSGLRYLLPYLRQNDDIAALIKLIAARFEILQTAVGTLLNMLAINDARGVWLDYIGKEVGAERDETDFGDFFCLNKLHLNVPKRFYFLTSGDDPRQPVTLQDFEFISKIMAYIGSNSAFGTIEELISIIKRITNAEEVHIEKYGSDNLKVSIYGSRLLLTGNTVNYIKQVLGNGIYLQEVTTNE